MSHITKLILALSTLILYLCCAFLSRLVLYLYLYYYLYYTTVCCTVLCSTLLNRIIHCYIVIYSYGFRGLIGARGEPAWDSKRAQWPLRKGYSLNFPKRFHPASG